MKKYIIHLSHYPVHVLPITHPHGDTHLLTKKGLHRVGPIETIQAVRPHSTSLESLHLPVVTGKETMRCEEALNLREKLVRESGLHVGVVAETMIVETNHLCTVGLRKSVCILILCAHVCAYAYVHVGLFVHE